MLIDRDIRLIDYFPQVIKQIREIQTICAIEDEEVTNAFNEIESVLNNQFVSTGNLYSVEKWEKFLKLTPSPNATLEQRKTAILSRLFARNVYTYEVLKEMIEALISDRCEIKLIPSEYKLTILIPLNYKKVKPQVESLARDVTPANIYIEIDFMWNTHKTLSRYTHEFLNAYTHKGLKEDYLDA